MIVRIFSDESPDAEVALLAFGEKSDGSGGVLIIQWEIDDDPEDTYCLSTETAATFYGGIEAINVSRRQSFIELSLGNEAAQLLALPQTLRLDLNLPPGQQDDVVKKVTRFSRLHDINLTEQV